MTFIYDLKELAAGKRPALAQAGQRYDHIDDHINLALAERLEALVTAVETMNGHLAVIAQIGPKVDELVKATKAMKA